MLVSSCECASGQKRSLLTTLSSGAATIAGAFGGLLAYGLTRIEAGSIPGWVSLLTILTKTMLNISQGWLFLVEGLLTVAAACMAYFTITDSPDKAKWLTQEEKTLLVERLKVRAILFSLDPYSYQLSTMVSMYQ